MNLPVPQSGRMRAALAALVVVLVGALLVALFADRTSRPLREWAVDMLMRNAGPVETDRIVVIEIDSESLDRIGPWPWPRDVMARLIGRVAGGSPAVIGVDILLAGPDRSSPQALARALALRSADPEAVDAVLTLPDPDVELAAALEEVPVVLSALLGPAGPGMSSSPPPPPILISGEPRLTPWHGETILYPHEPFFEAATATAGVGSLDAGAGGVVRYVPLFVTAGDNVAPGFAAEVKRRADKASAFMLDGADSALRIGDTAIPVTASATMRFRPSGPQSWAARSVPAHEILLGEPKPERFQNRVVLIGGAAPSLGALRMTASSPVAPPVQIQADALSTMLSGNIPFRGDTEVAVEWIAALALAVAGTLIGLVAAPLPAALTAFALFIGWSVIAVGAFLIGGRIVDPVTPGLAGFVAAFTAFVFMAIATRQSAARIRRRFEQHLAPSVVARMASEPGLLKLTGERRQVTALAADIENFTEVATAISPEKLVELLDRYFKGVTEIVVAHGGMVDKIVGDAVHALFNVPFDLENHAEKAIFCARDIIAFTKTFETLPEVAQFGLGRTRIGIETGDAVVGDVGAGDRLDYTAHGVPVITAARLESVNKRFGTSILVGPECRASAPSVAFRALGPAEIRGRGDFEVFEPIFSKDTA